MIRVLLIFISLFWIYIAQGQTCAEDQVSIVLRVETDRWAENAWTLSSSNTVYTMVDESQYAGKEIFLDTFCVPSKECLIFSITDGFGDGITEGGGFEIYVDATLVLQENQFGLSKSFEINCQPGTSCNQALLIEEGEHIAPSSETWYSFTPDTVGSFTISTCDNDCDTQIWVYDRCESFVPGEEEGFIFFDDNAGGCGFQAVVNAFLKAGETYLIRITDVGADCNNSPIRWSINYKGPVIGCMDPNSCNFNPLATIDDGTCLPQGDERCPDGPDFAIREDILKASLFVDTLNNVDECLIQEGCLTGFGRREIIRFTTRFNNIGELDYYIGEPSLDNEQFTFDNCHNHFHYDNYAEYLLFDANGQSIPSGFKSGFCVIDLTCPDGNNKYGCSNMGLSAGCFDEYGTNLDCQWIDVTDIPDGDITFVARVNWGNQPDALGRVEKNLLNNWAQVCMTLDRSSGQLEMTINEDCEIVADCEGRPYGNLVPDCEGICGGNALTGDIDKSAQQDMQDVQSYISMILENEETVTPCNDLNGDEQLTVYDAALLADCVNFGVGHIHTNQGVHSHCDFPTGVLNTTLEEVVFTISEINREDKYVDISMKNTSTDIVGFQLTLKGVQILSLENLVDIQQYPALFQANIGTGEIIGLSLQDSTIQQSRDFQPVLRVHFSDLTDDFLCLDKVTDIVNGNYQQVLTTIENPCVDLISSTNVVEDSFAIKVRPNPFSNTTTISFSNPTNDIYTLQINDIAGQGLVNKEGISGNNIEVSRGDLKNGIYYFQLIGERKTFTGKFVIQ